MQFSPETVASFRFIGYRFDEARGCARLDYGFDDRLVFTEEICFPGANLPLDAPRRAALQRVLRQLHLVAGLSYYKAAVPAEIRIETAPLDAANAAFLEKLYLNGLGEFAYRNSLDLRGRMRFPVQAEAAPPPAEAILPRRTVVPIGGGKDSLVSVELLRAAGQAVELISVGNPPIIAATAARSGLPHVRIQRRLSPLLFELNQQGAYNGHVPISAIIAYILAAAAILYGFDTVVMSNERSANTGNLVRDGFEVNHQYSKSLAFERDVQAQFAWLLPGFRYFSLLRPWSELMIAQRFAGLEAYHAVFSSCNANFRIHQDAGRGWCLDCPKCRFVFLALAPFMEKSQLLAIFGKNLLDEPSQRAGFRALLGVDAHKPFECVGEVEESTAALYLLSQQQAWRGDALVEDFRQHVLPRLDNPEALVKKQLSASEMHAIPEEFLPVLDSLPFKTPL